MKTYQLKFLAWTFSAFLSPDDPDAEKEADYYQLLDVSKNANADDIKKAYRKRSLQLHPDKLRQRGMKYQGKVITEDEARSQFQQMKAAYDTLSDPKKRQIYDALGHRGMDFVINPSRAYDPHVLMGNLAKSAVFDRAKLMALVLMFFGMVLLQPILICAKVDQMLEKEGALENSSWVAILIPFWFFSAFYGVLLVIGQAVLPLLQWSSFVVGILLLMLKFDGTLAWNYAALFIPFYLWMILRFVEAKKDMDVVSKDMSKMVTIEYIEKFVINEMKQDDDGNDIEDQLHRAYNDLNEEERDGINKEYIIVHVPPKAQVPGEDEDEEEDDFDRIERSPEYQEARARHEFASKSIQRIVIPEIPLMVLIIVQLDMDKSWNWGLTFLPLWISMFFECCGGCYGFFCTSALAHIEVQEQLAEHMAKEQEAKNETKEESKENDEEKGDVSKTGDAGSAKTDDTTPSGEKSGKVGAAEAKKPEKSGLDDKPTIDTAVSIEPPKTKETSNKESEADKANSEAKLPDDGDEDEDDFEFEMDEDTFHFYQQAEVEAENKATEAQSKAIGSFCNIIFQALIAALFVAKLNKVYEEREEGEMDGTSSFSSFWILFPFLLISGCIISCFACAIFGAANIDTALSSDDASESGGDDNAPGGEEAAGTDNNAASPFIMTPSPPVQEVESQAQKKAEEYTPPVVNTAENVGNSAAPADTVDSDQESGMSDLD